MPPAPAILPIWRPLRREGCCRSKEGLRQRGDAPGIQTKGVIRLQEPRFADVGQSRDGNVKARIAVQVAS